MIILSKNVLSILNARYLHVIKAFGEYAAFFAAARYLSRLSASGDIDKEDDYFELWL